MSKTTETYTIEYEVVEGKKTVFRRNERGIDIEVHVEKGRMGCVALTSTEAELLVDFISRRSLIT